MHMLSFSLSLLKKTRALESCTAGAIWRSEISPPPSLLSWGCGTGWGAALGIEPIGLMDCPCSQGQKLAAMPFSLPCGCFAAAGQQNKGHGNRSLEYQKPAGGAGKGVNARPLTLAASSRSSAS